MKNTLIIALISGVFAVNANANEQLPSEQVALEDVKSKSLIQDEENIIVADNSSNNALRLKFVGRRAKLNDAARKKDNYKPSDEWVGANSVKDNKANKRLNRQFRSKRPHIDYQFD